MEPPVNKKTMRHFYCRDLYWDAFEQMATDFDCSIDYLINEAMRTYAQGKESPAKDAPPSSALVDDAPKDTPVAPVVATPPPPPQPQARIPTPPSPLRPTPKQRPLASTVEDVAADSATLFLWFNNQRTAIDKDQFIIGRGTKTSDLTIKDGNISRKHAAVIRRNGSYYIKDLGSTNGIDYNGMRIDNKRIDEGDVFHICDYELRFTYQP